ncbi:pepsin-like aspartic protease [Flavobacterium sp. N502540]|uniref:pepsin-like aspartic protease n=1 Tax=Flavobacterium sp. N502540 TaxID=2986838 RepID=UPI00222511B1|nr:pepsin-like aspartic protease [Flavobacterium sp. N502540]
MRTMNFKEELLSRIERYKDLNLINKKPVVKDSTSASAVLPFKLQRGAITNNGATPWYILAIIGTNSVSPQIFKFMMDTGTIDTWITAKTCTTNECKAHASFDATSSSSFVWVDQALDTINFGPWGSMKVNLGIDFWSLTDINNVKSSVSSDFWLSQLYSGIRFEELVQDGFIACGPSGNSSRSNLLFNLMWDSGLLLQPFMAYWVDYTIDGKNVDSGEIIFGGGNSSKYDPATIITLDIIKDIYWTSPCDSIVINSKPVLEDVFLIMDTGASEIKGEQAEIDILIAAVTLNGALPIQPENDPDDYNYPDLVFNFGKTSSGGVGQLVFKPRQYFNYIENGPDMGTWQIAFTVLAGLGDRNLTFGTNLLDTLYSEWEYDTSGEFLSAKSIRLAKRL